MLSIGPLLLLLDAAVGDLRPLSAAAWSCCVAALLLSWFGGRPNRSNDGWAQGVCAFALNVCAGLQFTYSSVDDRGYYYAQEDSTTAVCLTVLSVLAAAIGSRSSNSEQQPPPPPPPDSKKKDDVIVLMRMMQQHEQQPPALNHQPTEQKSSPSSPPTIARLCWLLAVAVLLSPLWYTTTTHPRTTTTAITTITITRALLCADWFASANRATPVSTAAAAAILLVHLLVWDAPTTTRAWFCAVCVWPCVFGTAARGYGARLARRRHDDDDKRLLFAIAAGATLGLCAAHDRALQLALLTVHAIARWLSVSIYCGGGGGGAVAAREPKEEEHA